MKVQWWEKTVEYQFVSEVSRRGRDGLLSPFDGHHEQAGDAMFADASNRWLLLEFKRDVHQLNSEVQKFHDYRIAAYELGTNDSHHLLAYGWLADPSELRLAFYTYFSRKSIDSLEAALGSACPFDMFKRYVARLIELKRGPGGGDDGGSAARPSYEAVLGVSSVGGVVATMTLSDFAAAFGSPTLDPPTLDPPSDSPRFRARGM